jgi:hypothetical protein
MPMQNHDASTKQNRETVFHLAVSSRMLESIQGFSYMWAAGL